MGVYKLKFGPSFFFFISIISFSLQKEEDFEKNKQKQPKKHTLISEKLVQLCCWTSFYLYLDQFLTYNFCYFFCFFWVETPNFIGFSAKHAKFRETQKRKRGTIYEHKCANCSCQNVRFPAFFMFALFSISIFSELFLNGFPK